MFRGGAIEPSCDLTFNQKTACDVDGSLLLGSKRLEIESIWKSTSEGLLDTYHGVVGIVEIGIAGEGVSQVSRELLMIEAYSIMWSATQSHIFSK